MTDPTNAEIAATLDAGADRIERDGWWGGRDRYYSPDGTLIAEPTADDRSKCKCAWTSMSDRRGCIYAAGALESALGLSGDVGVFLIGWNDAQPSARPVIAAMRACAADLRGRP